jgi:hypothetical protein
MIPLFPAQESKTRIQPVVISIKGRLQIHRKKSLHGLSAFTSGVFQTRLPITGGVARSSPVWHGDCF